MEINGPLNSTPESRKKPYRGNLGGCVDVLDPRYLANLENVIYPSGFERAESLAWHKAII